MASYYLSKQETTKVHHAICLIAAASLSWKKSIYLVCHDYDSLLKIIQVSPTF